MDDPPPYILILLTKGVYAIISPEDKDLCSLSWTLHKSRENRYACHRYHEGGDVYGRTFLHTEILERMLQRPLDQVNKSELADHINRNTLDCRRSNLRLSDRSLNALNTEFKNKYRGVGKTKTGKFRAYIQKDGRQRHLGTFDAELDAAEAYNVAALELFGEYARLNDLESDEPEENDGTENTD